MICGFLESSEFLLTPVFRTLPPLLVDRAEDDQVSALIKSTVGQILALTENAAPGSELMLGRLMELLFVEVLRRYATRLPASAKGWFAALNDPLVGRAIQSVHADPAPDLAALTDGLRAEREQVGLPGLHPDVEAVALELVADPAGHEGRGGGHEQQPDDDLGREADGEDVELGHDA